MTDQHHTHHVRLLVATYALLIVAAPLIWAPGAHAQTIGCPTGYVCTPIQQVSNCPTGFQCTPVSVFGGGGGFNNTNTTTSGGSTFTNGYYYNGSGYNSSAVSSPAQPVGASQATASCYVFGADLAMGSIGGDVTALQKLLAGKGYPVSVSGTYDYQTANAVSQYQTSLGIPATGYVGPITRARLNADCSTSTATIPSKAIYWSNGGSKVQLGVVDSRFESNRTVLGWMVLQGGSSGSVNWSKPFVTDLTGTVDLSSAVRSSAGPFRIIAVTSDASGNSCFTPNSSCLYTLSQPFALADSQPITLSLPSSAITQTSPLSAVCSGATFNSGVPGISWSSTASGGRSPYFYSWSMYNDVTNYGEGSTRASGVMVNYATVGSKQAVVRITDSNGTTVNATCSADISGSSVTPPFVQPIGLPLSVSCSGSAGATAGTLVWNAPTVGGTSPYSYSWSFYNDVSNYEGTTRAANVTVDYSGAGAKQAIVSVTDSAGETATASCGGTAQAVQSAPAPTPTPVTQSPSTTLLISLRTIRLGSLVTLLSNTVSPSSSLKSAAIDLSTDNANWTSGAPCGYWNSPTGTDAAHAITCNFTPTATGTYYFRSRGTDGVGSSAFSTQTLTVTQ